MSLVYGEQDVILDNSLHKSMYDTTVPESRESIAMSHVESLNVFQIRRTNSNLATSQQRSKTGETTSVTENKSAKFCCPTCPTSPCRISFKVKYWKAFRERVNRIVSSSIFDIFIIFCILLNTLFMAIEHHGMDKDLQRAVNIVNMVSCLYKKSTTLRIDASVN